MSELILKSPVFNELKKVKRKGFKTPEFNFIENYVSSIKLDDRVPIVYEVSKLTHNGIIGFKRFEGITRSIHKNSFDNLLSTQQLSDSTVSELVHEYKKALTDYDKKLVNNKAQQLLNQDGFDMYLVKTHQSRKLNQSQSRKVRKMSEKLSYYTQTRKFTSKKSGEYKMKIAFLTLTAPDNSTPKQLLNAFTKFLEYLHRTANCYYVWKKELGETHKHLHFHIVVNNFIPYYIVSWKWKRLLIGEGVSFTKENSNNDSNAHTRIELPKSKRQVSHYISKYMSKAYELPGDYGYIAGFSQILGKLPELVVEPDSPLNEEIRQLSQISKVIKHDYVSIVCVDLLTIKERFPNLYATFEKQYLENSELITLPQRFNYV